MDELPDLFPEKATGWAERPPNPPPGYATVKNAKAVLLKAWRF